MRLFVRLGLLATLCVTQASCSSTPQEAEREGGAGLGDPLFSNPEPVAWTPAMDNAALPAGEGEIFQNACSADSYAAEQRPLTIYALFDDSGSMFLAWPFVTNAFIQFAQDPASAGINVGIKFFGEVCDQDFYATPDVPIDTLPANAGPIENALGLHLPVSGTATTPALLGGLQAAQQRANTHPDEKVIILLATDGRPSNCDATLESASAAAQLARDAGIPVYVLGLGDLPELNQLAAAGGTGNALSADPAMVDLVVQAMNEIRNQALPCDYALPPGGESMLGSVNLVYRDGAGEQHVVPGVDALEACTPDQGGWYYNETGDRLVSCPKTCELLKGGSTEVNVVLGCPTQPPS